MSDCHPQPGSLSSLKKGSLPYDVLQLVFSDVHDIISSLGENRWAIQRSRLCQVCHLWQDALELSPSLWCQLYIPVDASYETVSRLIKRASDSSGTAIMRWWLGSALPDLQPAMDHDEMVRCSQQLDLIASRCGSLSIDDGLMLHAVATLIPTAPLSLLTSMTVGHISMLDDRGNTPRGTWPRLCVDKLQDLCVHLPSMALSLLPETVHVTSMRLTVPSFTDPWMLIKFGARSLTDLSIEYLEPSQIEQPILPPGPPIIMHKLTTFNLEVPPNFQIGLWLLHMRFPCVKLLTIGFRDHRTTRFSLPESSDLAPALNSDGMNHFPSLRAITLCARAMPHGFITFICSQRLLRNLAFVGLGTQGLQCVSTALGVGQALPRLRYVHFYNCHFHGCHISEDDKMLVELVATRRALRLDAIPFMIKCTSSATSR